MKFIPKSRNWSRLIEFCSGIKKFYLRANKETLDAIDSFCKNLSDDDVVLGNANSSGYIWKSKSIFECFCISFNPALKRLCPENSFLEIIFNQYGISFPLSTINLQKETCLLTSDKFRKIAQYINDQPPMHYEAEWGRMTEVSETMVLLSDILDSIHRELKNEYLDWCKLCFRRCDFGNNFCDLHHSTNTYLKNGKKIQNENPRYRIARKVSKKIPEDIKSKWRGIRAARKLMGDDFIIFSSEKTILEDIPSEIKAISIDDIEIKNLVFDTQNTPWTKSLCKRWNDEIRSSFPRIYSVSSCSTCDFKSWDEYRNALIKLLQNQRETTFHPYWILMMLNEAEDWFVCENSLIDLRRSNTESEILELVANGLKNFEIARQLDISSQRVGKVKKLNAI